MKINLSLSNVATLAAICANFSFCINADSNVNGNCTTVNTFTKTDTVSLTDTISSTTTITNVIPLVLTSIGSETASVTVTDTSIITIESGSTLSLTETETESITGTETTHTTVSTTFTETSTLSSTISTTDTQYLSTSIIVLSTETETTTITSEYTNTETITESYSETTIISTTTTETSIINSITTTTSLKYNSPENNNTALAFGNQCFEPYKIICDPNHPLQFFYCLGGHYYTYACGESSFCQKNPDKTANDYCGNNLINDTSVPIRAAPGSFCNYNEQLCTDNPRTYLYCWYNTYMLATVPGNQICYRNGNGYVRFIDPPTPIVINQSPDPDNMQIDDVCSGSYTTCWANDTRAYFQCSGNRIIAGYCYDSYKCVEGATPGTASCKWLEPKDAGIPDSPYSGQLCFGDWRKCSPTDRNVYFSCQNNLVYAQPCGPTALCINNTVVGRDYCG